MTQAYPKAKLYRNAKILKAAEGQQCQMRSPVCEGRHETVIAAHSNLGRDGKGAKIKAHDLFVCYLCHECHDWYDGRRWNSPTHFDVWPRFVRQEYFDKGMKRTQRIILNKGLLS